jgi:hypothetical protein
MLLARAFSMVGVLYVDGPPRTCVGLRQTVRYCEYEVTR